MSIPYTFANQGGAGGATVPASELDANFAAVLLLTGGSLSGQLNMNAFIQFSPDAGFVFNNGLGPIVSSDSYNDGTGKVTGKAITGLVGTFASGNATISSVSPNPITAGALAGDPIYAPGYAPGGATILSLTATTIVMTANANGSSAGIAIVLRPDTNWTVEPAETGGNATFSFNRRSGVNEARGILSAQIDNGYYWGQLIRGISTYAPMYLSFDGSAGNAAAALIPLDPSGVYPAANPNSYLRIPNNKALFWRNFADSADLEGISIDISNNLLLGTSATSVRPMKELITLASTTSNAGFELPHGVAPTSPTNGETWTTTAGFFIRINGVTKTVTLT